MLNWRSQIAERFHVGLVKKLHGPHREPYHWMLRKNIDHEKPIEWERQTAKLIPVKNRLVISRGQTSEKQIGIINELSHVNKANDDLDPKFIKSIKFVKLNKKWNWRKSLDSSSILIWSGTLIVDLKIKLDSNLEASIIFCSSIGRVDRIRF